MDLRQKLIDLAREATGDPTITVAGDFQPKGMTWKVAAGAAAGSVLGDALGGDTGQALGAAGGVVGGQYAATSGQLPAVVVLAASPTKLYLMTTNNATMYWRMCPSHQPSSPAPAKQQHRRPQCIQRVVATERLS